MMSQIDKILDNDSGSSLAWFFAGAALGVAVGMLFAPKSGSEARRYIAEKAGSGRDAVSGLGRDMVDRSKELYEKGRELAGEASDLFERGRRLARGENQTTPTPPAGENA
jgi:gas vesicle protein